MSEWDPSFFFAENFASTTLTYHINPITHPRGVAFYEGALITT